MRARVPARLRNRDSWAWHAGTLVQGWAFLTAWLTGFGVLRPGNFLIASLSAVAVVSVTVWKNERRRLWRTQRELRHTQDNCAWLQQQLSEAVRVPPPKPPQLATLTVQQPRIWGPPQGECEWEFVPLWVHADSPHDPGAVVTGVRLPRGAPWHTSS